MNVTQQDFHTALRKPSDPIPEGLRGTGGQAAGRRFNVYRNNVATSLMDALASGFPVIKKLLGEKNFRNLARDFQWQNPPASPLMMLYGEGFADYLSAHPALVKFPYLGDVARLEYALRQSYHAADTPEFDANRLQAENLLKATFTLAPSLKLLTSDYPVFSIWRANTQLDAPKPVMQAETVAIFRPDYDPIPEVITPADAAMLASLLAGNPLETALSEAQDADPEHDFTHILGRMLAGCAIADIQFPEG